MRYLLIALAIISHLPGNCQTLIADTLYFGTPPNCIKVVVYRNAATTTIPPTARFIDSIAAVKAAIQTKADSLATALASSIAATYFTIANAANKLATNGNGSGLTGITAAQVGAQAVGNYASGVTNTGDNATNTQYSGLAATIATKASIYVGTDAGANDSYVITASPVPGSYTTGMVVIFKANTQNTTGATINVSGLGVKNIIKRVSTTLATGDILALMYCQLIYDGNSFVLLNPVVN